MVRAPMALAAALAFLATLAQPGGGEAAEGGAKVDPGSWDAVKLAVAEHHVVAHDMGFAVSLEWWADERAGRDFSGPIGHLAFENDLVEEVSVPGKAVVHIRGDLIAPLHVGNLSEVVVGGSVRSGGRIDADGIVFIHVQGGVLGTLACRGMARVWIGGDLRGEVLTGEPGTHLHVKGDLAGTVRPILRPAALFIDVRGHAPAAVLARIARNAYAVLDIAVASSDLETGIHPLESGTRGFVVVTGAAR